MHISDETQIVLVTRSLTYSLPPLLNQFKNLALYTRGVDGGSLGKSADKFVLVFLGADLEVEGVSAVFDTDV